MNIYDAACDMVNRILGQIRHLQSLGFKDNMHVYKTFADLDFIERLVNSSYETKDGKNDDLEMLIKLVHHVLNYHIDRGDIHTITHVKPKENNEGWTSCHRPE
ncbi:hypothetical protein [Burkholderia cepacia]|uniref:hypothetical protein n=1 Tax=Burkholderia cepacia TaxID=292 RepID=UPI000B16EADF|nr:hypothetical protein [Burkholderia cepacia]